MPSQQSPLPISYAYSVLHLGQKCLSTSSMHLSCSHPTIPSTLHHQHPPSWRVLELEPPTPSNHLQPPRNVDSHCAPSSWFLFYISLPPDSEDASLRLQTTERTTRLLARWVWEIRNNIYPEMKLGCLPGLRQLFLLGSSRSRRQRLCEGRRDRVVNLHSQWERS